MANRKVLIDDYDKAAETEEKNLAFKTLRYIYTKKTSQVGEKTAKKINFSAFKIILPVHVTTS